VPTKWQHEATSADEDEIEAAAAEEEETVLAILRPCLSLRRSPRLD